MHIVNLNGKEMCSPDKVFLYLENREHSDYDWFNIEVDNLRVGKIRAKKRDRELIIYSMEIFSCYRNQGLARKVIAEIKEAYAVIRADRVKAHARGFWRKMGFIRKDYDTFYYQTAARQ